MNTDTRKQEYWAPMEEELKQLLNHLYIHQRDSFSVVYRLLYQWKVETTGTKGFIQLLEENISRTEKNSDIVQELQLRVERLDASLANCLSIANSLSVE